MTQPEQEAREMLAACPFCGGEAVAEFSHELGRFDVWRVGCGACDVEFFEQGTTSASARMNAITKWNQRARPTAGIDREVFQAALADLLYKFDPMCGRTDCKNTAKIIAPLLLESLPAAAKTGERGAVIEGIYRVIPVRGDADKFAVFDVIMGDAIAICPDRIAAERVAAALSQPLPDAPIVSGEGER